jgi:two-component system phosphate regulon response regulator OmpR
VRFGPFTFRFDRGELRHEEDVVRITEREREILTILGARAGGNVPREDLSGGGSAANERTVDVQINRLRRKIEIDPANPVFLQTVRGIGYRLVVDR